MAAAMAIRWSLAQSTMPPVSVPPWTVRKSGPSSARPPRAVSRAAVAVVLLRRIVRHPLGVAAGFLILSGGVGNIIDRVRLGYVVDMFHLEFWPSYPVFNVADICVVCGAVLAVIYYLWFYEKYDKRGKAHGDADAPSES